MDSKALINGEIVELNDKDRTDAEEFHKNRIAFAYVNDKFLIGKLDDERDHNHWLKEDHGIDDTSFEEIIRGYIMNDRIQVYVGSDFRPVDYKILNDETFNKHLVEELVPTFIDATHRSNLIRIWVYNGVQIGRVGDVWEPLYCVGDVYSEDGKYSIGFYLEILENYPGFDKE